MDEREFSARASALSSRIVKKLTEVMGEQNALAEKEGEDLFVFLVSAFDASTILVTAQVTPFLINCAQKAGITQISEQQFNQIANRLYPSIKAAVAAEMEKELIRMGVRADQIEKLKWFTGREGHA